MRKNLDFKYKAGKIGQINFCWVKLRKTER